MNGWVPAKKKGLCCIGDAFQVRPLRECHLRHDVTKFPSQCKTHSPCRNTLSFQTQRKEFKSGTAMLFLTSTDSTNGSGALGPCVLAIRRTHFMLFFPVWGSTCIWEFLVQDEFLNNFFVKTRKWKEGIFVPAATHETRICSCCVQYRHVRDACRGRNCLLHVPHP